MKHRASCVPMSLLALTLLAPWPFVGALGCSDDGGGQEFVCEGELVGNTCVADGTGQGDTGGGNTGQDDTGGGDTGQDDTGGDDTGAATGDETGDDTAGDTGGDEPECDEAVAGSKPMGAGCEAHCECETGYCYDEAYLGPFRFCTRNCDWNCNADVGGGIEAYKCLLLGGTLANEYDLTETSICQAVCTSVDDCKVLSSEYDACGYGSGTQWDGHTVAAAKTCAISEYMDNE